MASALGPKADELAHASNAASSRHRVTTSQVVRSSVGRRFGVGRRSAVGEDMT